MRFFAIAPKREAHTSSSASCYLQDFKVTMLRKLGLLVGVLLLTYLSFVRTCFAFSALLLLGGCIAHARSSVVAHIAATTAALGMAPCCI